MSQLLHRILNPPNAVTETSLILGDMVCATKLELWQDLCKTQRSITVIESILLKTISRFKICLSFFLRLNCEFDKTCSETDSGTVREICC